MSKKKTGRIVSMADGVQSVEETELLANDDILKQQVDEYQEIFADLKSLPDREYSDQELGRMRHDTMAAIDDLAQKAPWWQLNTPNYQLARLCMVAASVLLIVFATTLSPTATQLQGFEYDLLGDNANYTYEEVMELEVSLATADYEILLMPELDIDTLNEYIESQESKGVDDLFAEASIMDDESFESLINNLHNEKSAGANNEK